MKTLLLLTVVVSLVLCSGPATGQGCSPNAEIVVLFADGVVERPAGRTAGRPAEFVFDAPSLRTALLAAGVEHMRQIIPGFTPENRLRQAPWGETVELTDWSQAYVLRLPPAARRGLVEALRHRADVVYAELNRPLVLTDQVPEAPAPLVANPVAASPPPALIPNDTYFPQQWALRNTGTPAQGSGTVDADVDASEAWDTETGSPSITIGIVDSGIELDHPDFAGRATGDPTDIGPEYDHGTEVAGVAAAQGDNGIGIAGMAWDVGIVNEDLGCFSNTEAVDAIHSAIDRGVHAFNNSWRLLWEDFSIPVRQAFADAYRMGLTAVAAIGNDFGSGNRTAYPAAFTPGIVAVGATTNEDTRASYSSTGPWIDVAAPGGEGSCETGDEDCVFTTTIAARGYYKYKAGTSFAAPHVTGLAALLMSHRPDLTQYPDDVEGLIRASADDLTDGGNGCTAGPGFDECFGAGRINAAAALALLGPPYTLTRGHVSGGGTVVAVSPTYDLRVYNPNDDLADGWYLAKRHTVERTVTVGPYQSAPHAWGRGGGALAGGATVGWAEESYGVSPPYTFGLPTTEVVQAWTTQLTLRTYVYEISDDNGVFYGWYPTTPPNASFAYTVVGVPCLGGGICARALAGEGLPEDFALQGASPNPFVGETELTFLLPEPAHVALTVHDVLGREVAVLVDEPLPAGTHRASFDGSGLPGGVYVVRGRAGARTAAARVTLLR